MSRPDRTTQHAFNELAYKAASLSSHIRATHPDPADWKAAIAEAPEDVRELVREYLRQAWRGMQHRAKAEAERGGPVAAAEIQKLREKLG